MIQGADSKTMALILYNGRSHPEEHMDDWGFKGPIFFVDSVQITYATHINFLLRNKPDNECDGTLYYFQDLVYYDGKYYGDIAIMPALELNPRACTRVEDFKQDWAEVPSHVKKIKTKLKGHVRRLRLP